MITNKLRGDTLIEVTLAVGIFSMVAIAAVAVLSGGTSSAQTALETTLAREEIDAQSEAIRFIQSAALAENGAGGGSAYTALYDKIAELAKGTSGYTGTNNKSCNDMYNNDAYKTGKAFIINTHALSGYVENYNANGDKAIDDVLVVSTSDNREEGSKKLFRKTQTYPHLIYSNDTSNTDKDKLINNDLEKSGLYAAAGIYVVAVTDKDTTYIVDSDGGLKNDKRAFDDFYVQTCWYGSGSDTASTISTVIRLYNPQADIAQTVPTYRIYYRGNGADTYSGGATTQVYRMTNEVKTASVLENNFTKLCYNPITARDIWGDSAPNTPIWTTDDYGSWDFDGYSKEKEMINEWGYLLEKQESFKNYLKRELGASYNSSGTDKYYVSGNKIALFSGELNPTRDDSITLYAQWHRDYNNEACSPLYVGYTTTGNNINVAGTGDETPNRSIYGGATQGFIVPDTRATNDTNRRLYPHATGAASLPHYISADKLKFPDSTCVASNNGWKFISDRDSFGLAEGAALSGDEGNMGIMKFPAFGSFFNVRNITYFDNDHIISAKFANNRLAIKKGPEPSYIYFNVSCTAPSMQTEVDMEYCKANAYGKEIVARDERDGKNYHITYQKVGWLKANLLAWLSYENIVSVNFPVEGSYGFCVMTEDLRFEGKDAENKKNDEKDIEFREENGKNIGSNVEPSVAGMDLIKINPDEVDTWLNDDNDTEARFISVDLEDPETPEALRNWSWGSRQKKTTLYNFGAVFVGYELPDPEGLKTPFFDVDNYASNDAWGLKNGGFKFHGYYDAASGDLRATRNLYSFNNTVVELWSRGKVSKWSQEWLTSSICPAGWVLPSSFVFGGVGDIDFENVEVQSGWVIGFDMELEDEGFIDGYHSHLSGRNSWDGPTSPELNVPRSKSDEESEARYKNSGFDQIRKYYSIVRCIQTDVPYFDIPSYRSE